MITFALMTGALLLVQGVMALFALLPLDDLDLPASAPDVDVPVPVLTTGQVAALQTWFVTSIGVALALVVGNGLQWVYAKIPFKMT